MKRLFLTLIAAFFSISAFCQAFATHLDGSAVVSTAYVDVQGSPFLTDDWTPMAIKLDNNDVYNAMAKYDEVKDQVYFKGDDGAMMEFKVPVKEFAMGNNSYRRTFTNGFPAASGTNNRSFFEVLVPGKTQFLKKTIKQVNETKEYNSANTIRIINSQTKYFLFTKGQLYPVKKDKKSILTALADKQNELETYIKDKSLNLKEEADIAKLVAYYNTL